MTVYVAEISGRGIVAFEATDEAEATAQLAGRDFQRDLYVLQNGGQPLWDGVSEVRLREALPNEAETWRTGRATAGQPEDSSYDEENARVFLIPVVDPSSFDDDDHDDHDNGD